MGLAAPLALLGLLFVPLIIAFYMLRLRRAQQPVSSTYLWQQLVRDVEANAPWQRLRRSLLLLLQLLLAILLAVLVARPFVERPAGLARDLVLVVDSSASMAATDVFPNRLSAAKRSAIEAMAQIPNDGRVSVVAAAETARVVANEATDRGRIARAIESIEQSTASGDLTDALRLAGKLAERARGAEILVVTDDAGSSVPQVAVAAPVRVLTVGRERDNQAIAALAVRADPSGLKRSVFTSVANYSASEVVRRLQILADGTSVTARDVVLRPLSRADVIIDELPPGTRVVEARITTPGDPATAVTGSPDFLPLDDAAWAVVPPDRPRYVLLVGPGNVFLQNAFSLLPNVELYGTTAEKYAATSADPVFENYDLVVFDGFLPPELPRKPILAFAPPSTSALGVVTGTLDEFGVGQLPPDEPLLSGVDLSRIHIARTQQMELPAWARAVIPGSDGPLLYSGLREGLATTVFAFDLRQTDLGLQYAWPILVSNLATELLGLGPNAPDPLAPSSPIDLPVPPDSVGVRVTLPDGTVQELVPGATGAGTVSFVSTRLLGIYRAELIAEPDAPSSAGTSPPASATPTATSDPAPTGPSSSGLAAGTTREPLLFAVDLFSAEESNIRPGDGARISALGSDDAGAPSTAPLARDELWPLLVVLALAFLIAEWLVYERDGARRIAHTLRRSLPRAMRARRG
ncbi:MAG TPA: VWA domain-containing protein [Candidatus Caenarcaniphilales bacterium]|nr:VWA domain-containing protein [Candidatus Caenarcaniphilales bacterium]